MKKLFKIWKTHLSIYILKHSITKHRKELYFYSNRLSEIEKGESYNILLFSVKEYLDHKYSCESRCIRRIYKLIYTYNLYLIGLKVKNHEN